MARIVESRHRSGRVNSGAPRGISMFRKTILIIALGFAASIFVQVIAISQADAGSTCTYTSSDKKKGYKC
jgi:hypothetical protein